tara:strand:- start:636 stop:1004 length:369 start_codon:yes stop_codon:yes gene_type:complete
MVLIFPHLIKTKDIFLILLKKILLSWDLAHNVYEIRTKELQNVKKIFLSSIFKKNKNYLGFYKFKLLFLLTERSLIALGGISDNNLKKLSLTSCHGFAGITFFEKKRPLKRGPFINLCSKLN